MQLADRIEEPLRLGLFEQVTTRAGAHGGEDGVVISVHGKHEDGQFRKLSMQTPNALDSRHAGQADVGQEHIRPHAFERRKGFLHGSVLTADFKTGRAANERRQAFTSGSLVLNQGDSNLRHVKRSVCQFGGEAQPHVDAGVDAIGNRVRAMGRPALSAIAQDRRAFLNWKGLQIEAEWDPTAPQSERLYWRQHSYNCLGPDGKTVHEYECNPSRACYKSL